MKNLLIILTVPLLLFSCKKKKIYHSFTEKEKSYLVYDLGDIFKLKDENTGEVHELTITNRYLKFQEDFNSTSTRTEHFMEEGRVEFSGAGIEGYIYIYIYIKDKRNDFSIGLSFLKHPDFSFRASGESAADSIEDITIDNTPYTKVERFNDIYFSKEYGFVKLEHSVLDVLLTRMP